MGVAKLIVAFRNFANAPENEDCLSALYAFIVGQGAREQSCFNALFLWFCECWYNDVEATVREECESGGTKFIAKLVRLIYYIILSVANWIVSMQVYLICEVQYQ